jgi:glyoxylase-like metal-dependent hydrolase (beta-lactamase superfamily II)
MAKVDVLLKGYDEGELTDKFQKYACSTTLVRADGRNIIVDPGTHKDQKLYIDALKSFDLTLSDIEYVFITHEHLDHSRDIALFPNATVIDGQGFHKGDEHNFSEDETLELFKGVVRIATPGHTKHHASLIVDTKDGKVCVAGDVWWYEDFTPAIDPYAVNQKALENSREMILEMVDFVIPGHGGLTKVFK